jgi:hypothetical protein
VYISDVHTGETLPNFTLGRGDVAITDRGDGPPAGMGHAFAQGAQWLVRLTPFRGVLGDPAGPPLALRAALTRQPAATIYPLEGALRSASGAAAVRGWGSA